MLLRHSLATSLFSRKIAAYIWLKKREIAQVFICFSYVRKNNLSFVRYYLSQYFQLMQIAFKM